MAISPAQWAAFKQAINDAHTMFNQDTITWMRKISGLQRYGEDDTALTTHTAISLLCLMSYNVYRTWPMTTETPSGQKDEESMCAIFNMDYLRGLGYINANNNFDMDPADDYFIFQGHKYRAKGETPAAQANNEPLLFYLILARMETKTGSDKY